MQRLEERLETRPWLRWVNKPQQRNASLLTFVGHSSPVQCHGFSPDGRYVVAGYGDGMLTLWNPDTGREVRTLAAHKEAVTTFAFSPDGTRLVSGSSDHTLKVWELNTGAEMWAARHGEPVQACAFVDDGSRIASVSSKESVKLWDARNGAEKQAWRIRVTPRERAIWLAQSTVLLLIWIGLIVAFSDEGKPADDWARGLGISVIVIILVIRELCPSAAGKACGFSPDGHKLAWNFKKGRVKIYDTALGAELLVLKRKYFACAFSPDGNCVAAFAQSEPPQIWDIAARQERMVSEVDLSGYRVVGVSPPLPCNGTHIVPLPSGSLQLWESAASHAAAPASQGEDAPVQACGFSPSGKSIVSSFSRGQLKEQEIAVWDAVTGSKRFSFPLREKPRMYAWAFMPDGERIISEISKNRLTFLDLQSGGESVVVAPLGQAQRVPWVMPRRGFKIAGIVALAVLAVPIVIVGGIILIVNLGGLIFDHKWVIALDSQLPVLGYGALGAFVLWILLSILFSLLLLAPYWRGAPAMACAISPDGKRFADQRFDGWFRVWEAATGIFQERYCPGEKTTFGYTFLTYSPDGTALLLQRPSGIDIQDVASAELRAVTQEKKKTFKRCVFSPDGSHFLSQSTDQELTLWNAKSLISTATFTASSKEITPGIFSPDGTRIVVGNADGALGIREVPSGEECARIPVATSPVTQCEFSPDGSWISCTPADQSLRIWHVAASEPSFVFPGTAPITATGWHPNSRSLAVGDEKGQLMLLRLENASLD